MISSSTTENDFIEIIKQKLIEIYHPHYIYLFGSYAWGTPDKSSDYDLCIILKESNLSMSDRIRQAGTALLKFTKPIDLLVYTEKEFKEKQSHTSSLVKKIADNGVLLYESA